MEEQHEERPKQEPASTPSPVAGSDGAPGASGGRAIEQELQRVGKVSQAVLDEVAKVIVGKRDVMELVMAGILSQGCHVLFEDLPGLGKSLMVNTFSRALGCDFKRVQFTPDLLPADITGTYVFDQSNKEFTFHPGPIFSNFLLADEINRASPKTQSALLEAMAEQQVSVEGSTHKLEAPFMVMATQNPVEQEGTYPLPEAQMDRFMMKLSMGYPAEHEEAEILNRRLDRGKDEVDVRSLTNAGVVVRMQKAVERVHVAPPIVDYIAKIITKTRTHEHLEAGGSPRGSLAVMKIARAWAALDGRSYVTPDDVKRVSVPCLAHRVILAPEARIEGIAATEVIQDVVANTPSPRSDDYGRS